MGVTTKGIITLSLNISVKQSISFNEYILADTIKLYLLPVVL